MDQCLQDQASERVARQMPKVFTLAHVTDLHMGPLPAYGPRFWNTKRFLGMLNWFKGRCRAHQMGVLDALMADLSEQAPDHIAVTGDLVNIGLPVEHIRALAWLRRLGDPSNVSVVPGNHDIYTTLPDDAGAMRWRSYMASSDLGANENAVADSVSLGDIGLSARAASSRCLNEAEPSFPYVQRIGPQPGGIALIGLNSAIPTRPFEAIGRLGTAQLRRLADLLQRTQADGLIRIVLIHHPPLPGQSARRHGLADAAKLAAILDQFGAALVLHGHEHVNSIKWRRWRSDETGLAPPVPARVPVVGLASASMAYRYKGEPLARYNLYRIPIQTKVAKIELIGRGFAQPGGEIVELERRQLDPTGADTDAGAHALRV